MRYLSATEAGGWSGPAPRISGRLVQAALLTGCRYSELARLKCADFNRDSGTLAIRLSKGKIRHVVLTDEGQGSLLQMDRRTRPGRQCSCAPMATSGGLAPEAAAGRGKRAGRDCASGELPHPASYPRLASRHERRADGRHCRPTRSCRHPHDREALCASGAELCRADDPGEFSTIRFASEAQVIPSFAMREGLEMPDKLRTRKNPGAKF